MAGEENRNLNGIAVPDAGRQGHGQLKIAELVVLYDTLITSNEMENSDEA